ncbi:hypothetical protein, partial [Caldibacillus debilis]|uniref:hypothetical protein n=1 Tax=Caldibacillus debilis TaxID=301148 RepID=UPI0023F3B930
MNGFSNRASFPYVIRRLSAKGPFAGLLRRSLSFFRGQDAILPGRIAKVSKGGLPPPHNGGRKNSKNVLNKLIKRKNTDDTGNRFFHGKVVFLW